jgi:hypothetical protein
LQSQLSIDFDIGMPAVGHSVDHERFRAQLQHFIYSYGISAYDLGLHLAHDPTRAYDYPKGTVLPTRATRRASASSGVTIASQSWSNLAFDGGHSVGA